jgi:hypothetical protein
MARIIVAMVVIAVVVHLVGCAGTATFIHGEVNAS